jgi:hypothetical protein
MSWRSLDIAAQMHIANDWHQHQGKLSQMLSSTPCLPLKDNQMVMDEAGGGHSDRQTAA